MASTGEPRSTLVAAAPRFLVEDMDEALAFYGRLGFATTYHDGGFAIVERDGVALHFNASDGPMHGRGGVCWMQVTNIEALYDAFLPTNAVQSPSVKAKPWGMKEFYIKDPSCNLIIFGEPTPDAETGAE
ncbi:MAG TPA: VOC family protein [Ktedonobacterales bacterium]|nr:VOC family protein [Ktedonobacterales bacterium]